MALGFSETRLWKTAFVGPGQDPHKEPRARLEAEYRAIRDRAAILADQIPQEMREYTVHDVTHSDALWELADVIGGPSIELTPTEAYVLGGAMAVHDLGMGLAAWSGGLAELQSTSEWNDLVTAIYVRDQGRKPNSREVASPGTEVLREAVETSLREKHAEKGASLALASWSVAGGDEYHLIDNVDLRQRYGSMIGEIASSHGWSIEQVRDRFGGTVIGAPADCPNEWTVDTLKLASLLRLADAAHLDERRAPGFLRALRKPSAYSDLHWKFQGYLQRSFREGDRLIFTSSRPFDEADADAWWLCYDSVHTVDSELRAVDSLLSDLNRQRFAVRSVKGIDSPRLFAKQVRTSGWEPVAANIQVTDMARLVRQLGGESLYGEKPRIALRELIQNARDASLALSAHLNQPAAAVTVSLNRTGDGVWLTVEDRGVGMSTDVVTGPLIDFGKSYWGSALMRSEAPGLEASSFEPAGKFGIGFFSVFMLGDQVRVVTRRFDEASNDTKVLEFKNGTSGRPLLRKAVNSEVRHLGGTSVSVKLRGGEDGLLELLDRGRRGEAQNFAELCAFLAPMLDVDLEVTEGPGTSTVVVKANDWIDMEGVALLKRLSPGGHSYFNRGMEAIADISSRLSLLTVEGRPVGRIAVATAPPSVSDGEDWFDIQAYVTLGGLNTERELGGMAGVVQASPTVASRAEGALEIGGEVWSAWAVEQSTLIAGMVNDEIASADYTEMASVIGLFLSMGVEPEALYLARDRSVWMTASGLCSWAEGKQSATLVRSYAVDRTKDDLQVEHFWHGRSHVEIELDEDVLISVDHGGRYGNWDLLPEGEAHAAFEPVASDSEMEARARDWLKRNQWDVDGFLCLTLAKSWGISFDALCSKLQLFGIGEQEVGGRVDSPGVRVKAQSVWKLER
ncbi:HD domain-containing protein [Curtobacterium aurantiacum]|uniref:HD domain-containing protein n=1 Tax=Curtobacterium aurantiacum TaxID=3236919 RepID=UPI001BDF5815|nr:ATP-binding protein [Curtobacterium flaccumfaciens]MBT1678685.1 ATP-binding protein [Curtobacterium flaccumfaciens pv. flaccumfaciens]